MTMRKKRIVTRNKAETILKSVLQLDWKNDVPLSALNNDIQTDILKIILNNGFEAVLVTDGHPVNHKIIYANERFCSMTGYTLDELRGKSPRILSGPRTNSRVTERLKQALQDGVPFMGAATNYRKDGSTYMVQWNIFPVLGADGNPSHFVSIQKDLTDLRESLTRLKNSSQTFRLFLQEIKNKKDSDIAVHPCAQVAQKELQSNAEVLSRYVGSEEESSDDFFDFDLMSYETDSADSADSKTLTAEALFAQSDISESVIRDMQGIATNLSNMFDVYDIQDMEAQDRREFIEELQEMANCVMNFEEFIDISIALSELAVCMIHHCDKPLDFMIAEALRGLSNDIITWVDGVFTQRDASNVHWLDNSIIGSARQVLVFVRMQFEQTA